MKAIGLLEKVVIEQYLKWEYLAIMLKSLSEAYFFDYADILSYVSDPGVQGSTTWTDNEWNVENISDNQS